MTRQETMEDIFANDQGSIEGVVAAIAQLRDELQRGDTSEWENPTLESFLEALQAWVETMGPRLGGAPSWKFVEGMLTAAKIYE